jgi:uncharacterized spore protein YtfJ
VNDGKPRPRNIGCFRLFPDAARIGKPSTPAQSQSLCTLSYEERQLATEVTLRKPLEIDGLKIIPLATVGIGYGQRTAAPGAEALHGVGRILSPVGVLVVSNRGVQLLPVSKGLLEQLLGAVTPVLLQIMKEEGKETANATGTLQARASLLDLLATLYAFPPESGWKFGLFPWPLPLVRIFLSRWFVLALLIGVFLPRQTIAIAATLQADVLRAGLIGLLSYGVVFILVEAFTISIIGILFTLVLLVFIMDAELGHPRAVKADRKPGHDLVCRRPAGAGGLSGGRISGGLPAGPRRARPASSAVQHH